MVIESVPVMSSMPAMSSNKTKQIWENRHSIQRQAYVAKRVAATTPTYIHDLRAGKNSSYYSFNSWITVLLCRPSSIFNHKYVK